MNIVFTVTLSIISLLIMSFTFTKEFLTTKEGTYCEIKCAAAGAFYLLIAITLAYFLAQKTLIEVNL